MSQNNNSQSNIFPNFNIFDGVAQPNWENLLNNENHENINADAEEDQEELNNSNYTVLTPDGTVHIADYLGDIFDTMAVTFLSKGAASVKKLVYYIST